MLFLQSVNDILLLFTHFIFVYYLQKRGKPRTRVVLLHPADPSEDILSLLSDPVYRTLVVYIRGSPLNLEDLKAVRLHYRNCCAVFLWSETTR